VRGIALKIFLSFWLIFAVLIATFALLSDSGSDVRFQDHLRSQGTIASRLLEQHGVAGCNEYVATVAASTGLRLALFDTESTAVCSAPGDDLTDLQQYARTGIAPATTTGARGRVSVHAPSGQIFAVAGHALPRFTEQAVGPTFPYRALAYAIVLSGFVCFVMARYLARPLQLVRRASRHLAEGDLHARVGRAVGERHDEIGDLVRDFDVMAERIEELVHAQNQLLSDISHELRSPLARLNVALELARRKATPDVERDLGRIETEAERMNELIGRILALARAESDPQAAMSPVDLTALVQQVTADARYEAQRQDKHVEFQPTATPVVQADAALIASAVDNIVRNALRHTPDHTTVTVKLSATDREALINVRDHGPGVPLSELERIFSPFHRVERERTRETGGVGLGLAIARRAVAVHDGTIAAENAPDGGLLVTIRLPLRPAASPSSS